MNKETAQEILKINQETYTRIASDFSETRQKSWPEMDLMVKKYIKDNFNILDLGCGNGRLLLSFKNLKEINYLGLDNCSNLLPKNQDFEKIHTRFICGNILDLKQFADEEFDAIFMIASFNHIPSEELRKQTMQELNRILKPGGYLIMTNWNLWQIKGKKTIWKYKFDADKKDELFEDLKLKDVITMWQNKHPLYYRAFTKGEMKKLFKSVKFKVLENYYVSQGKKVNWWNGRNILTVGKKAACPEELATKDPVDFNNK